MVIKMLGMVGVSAAALFGVVSLADPPTSAVQAQSHAKRLYRSVTAGDCKVDGGRTACVVFSVQQERDWAGKYLPTTVDLTDYLVHENGYEFRNLNCPVDGSSLKVTSKMASLSASLHADVPGCVRSGEKVTYDPASFEPYYFTGTVTIDGEWRNPEREFTQAADTIQTDNATGEQQREKCRLYVGFLVREGGFTVQGIFHPFGTADSSGDYTLNRCSIVPN
jgi:hypothetical protein